MSGHRSVVTEGCSSPTPYRQLAGCLKNRSFFLPRFCHRDTNESLLLACSLACLLLCLLPPLLDSLRLAARFTSDGRCCRALWGSTRRGRVVADCHLGQLLPPLWELLSSGLERHERSMLLADSIEGAGGAADGGEGAGRGLRARHE